VNQAEIHISDGTQAGVTTTLALSMLLASLDASSANVALPALAEPFSAPFSQVQAIVVSYREYRAPVRRGSLL